MSTVNIPHWVLEMILAFIGAGLLFGFNHLLSAIKSLNASVIEVGKDVKITNGQVIALQTWREAHVDVHEKLDHNQSELWHQVNERRKST